MGGGEGENGEAFWEVMLHPCCEFWGGFGVVCDDFGEAAFGGWAVLGEEDAADVGGDFCAHVETRDVGLGVLLEVELAALPGDGWEDGAACGGEAGVVIGDDDLEALEAACLQALEERAPVDLGFGKGDAEAEDLAFPIRADAEGDEHGAVENPPGLADFFVSGIENDIGESAERARAPVGEIGIEPGRALADVSGADAAAAKLLDDGGDLSSGDALHIHLRHRESERLFAADALFQSGGIKIEVAADLRNGESDRADASGKRLGLEAIGVTLASFRALERLSTKRGGTLREHGLIDEDAKRIGEGIGAIVCEKLQDGIQEFRMIEAGHVCVLSWMFLRHPDPNPCGPPSARPERHSPPQADGCARLATLVIAPPPA